MRRFHPDESSLPPKEARDQWERFCLVPLEQRLLQMSCRLILYQAWHSVCLRAPFHLSVLLLAPLNVINRIRSSSSLAARRAHTICPNKCQTFERQRTLFSITQITLFGISKRGKFVLCSIYSFEEAKKFHHKAEAKRLWWFIMTFGGFSLAFLSAFTILPRKRTQSEMKFTLWHLFCARRARKRGKSRTEEGGRSSSHLYVKTEGFTFQIHTRIWLSSLESERGRGRRRTKRWKV